MAIRACREHIIDTPSYRLGQLMSCFHQCHLYSDSKLVSPNDDEVIGTAELPRVDSGQHVAGESIIDSLKEFEHRQRQQQWNATTWRLRGRAGTPSAMIGHDYQYYHGQYLVYT